MAGSKQNKPGNQNNTVEKIIIVTIPSISAYDGILVEILDTVVWELLVVIILYVTINISNFTIHNMAKNNILYTTKDSRFHYAMTSKINRQVMVSPCFSGVKFT